MAGTSAASPLSGSKTPTTSWSRRPENEPQVRNTSWAFRVVAFLCWEATGRNGRGGKGHLPRRGGAHQEILDVDRNASDDLATAGRVLPVCPSQTPGNGTLSPIHKCLPPSWPHAPRPGCQGRGSGRGSSAAHRAAGCGREVRPGPRPPRACPQPAAGFQRPDPGARRRAAAGRTGVGRAAPWAGDHPGAFLAGGAAAGGRPRRGDDPPALPGEAGGAVGPAVPLAALTVLRGSGGQPPADLSEPTST